VAGLVERGVELPEPGGALIRTNDTLQALNMLGEAARARAKATVIAVTGSVGKTGTKEALRVALAPSGATHVSQKSFNNQWGVPLSLANLPRDARFGVFEVGMNHAGEITPLAQMIRPDIAIITTVEPVHLEFFDSVEAIAEAKAEIFHGLEPGGTAILNSDSPFFDLLRGRAEQRGAGVVLDFGTGSDAFARLGETAFEADGSSVEAFIGDQRLTYRIGAPGRHLVVNSLAVLAGVHAAGADLERAAATLERYGAQKGRGERSVIKVAEGEVAIIDESYNANPASMRAALLAMAHTPRQSFGRRVAVLGDMLELGQAGGALHRELAEPVDEAGVDVVLACGPLMAELYDALPESRRGGYAETSEDLRPILIDAINPGDVVVIKGSLGSRMGPLVEALHTHLRKLGAASIEPAETRAGK
jgi:UDP-N-acetylmuramoyl-tripeptide--D-alanyl-D-alanine ligase